MLIIFNKFQVIIESSSGKEILDPAATLAWSPWWLQHEELVFWREPGQMSEVFVQSCSDRMSHGNNHTNLNSREKNDVQKVPIYGGKMCTSEGHHAPHNRLSR